MSEIKTRLSKNNRGFSVVELLIILVIIGVIGGVGWSVMQRQKTTKSSPQSSNTSGQTEKAAKSTTYQADITSKLNLQSIQLSGAGTQGLDIDAETGLVYAGNTGNTISKCDPGNVQQKPGRNTMSVIDPAKGKELALEATDNGPIWPAVDPKRNVVYMANSGSPGTISVHEKGTGKKLESITTAGMPHAFGILDNILVVSNTYDSSQTYYSAINLDTRKVIGNHKSPALPHPVVVDAEQKLAYMMGVQNGEVVVIDMTTGSPKETFTLDGGNGQLAISKKLGKIITDSNKPGTVTAIYDKSSKKSLAVLSFQGTNAPGTGLALDEEAGLFFVVIADQNLLGVGSLETMKPLGYFTVGVCPYAVRVDAARGKGYVTNSGDSTLTVFDLKEIRTATGQ